MIKKKVLEGVSLFIEWRGNEFFVLIFNLTKFMRKVLGGTKNYLINVGCVQVN